MKVSTTADRLRKIMQERDLKQTDILDLCKPYCLKHGIRLGRNDLSQYVAGKVEPKQNKISILALALSVSEAWLMGYDVPVERKINSSTGQNIYDLPEDVQRICMLVLRLDKTDRIRVMERIETLLESDKYQTQDALKHA